MTVFADRDLALRLERLVIAENHRFAQVTERIYPDAGSAWFELGGGVVIYLGCGSPVNGAWGLGIDDEVTAEDLADVESFFASRGERAVAALSPYVRPSLLAALGERGWAPRVFENVLLRELLGEGGIEAPDPHVEVRRAETPDERELWAAMCANGFSAPDDPSAADLRLARTAAENPDAVLLLGYVDGLPAGTGELWIADGVGWLSADTTLPQFRGRGVQRSLQRARLAMAREAGCGIAVSESVPGSASQRNMERAGFRVAYVRVECQAPELPMPPRDRRPRAGTIRF